LKLDIAFIKTKKKGSGVETISGFVHFYNGMPKEKRANRGVSIVVKKKLSRNVTDWESIDENLRS